MIGEKFTIGELQEVYSALLDQEFSSPIWFFWQQPSQFSVLPCCQGPHKWSPSACQLFGYLDWTNLLQDAEEVEIIGVCTDICVVECVLLLPGRRRWVGWRFLRGYLREWSQGAFWYFRGNSDLLSATLQHFKSGKGIPLAAFSFSQITSIWHDFIVISAASWLSTVTPQGSTENCEGCCQKNQMVYG